MVIATPYIGNVQKKRPAANAKENFFPLQSPTDATIRQGTMCDMPNGITAYYKGLRIVWISKYIEIHSCVSVSSQLWS